MTTLRLPRSLELHPRHDEIARALVADARPLWSGGTIAVAHVAFTPGLEAALQRAYASRQLERGLDHIEVVLRAEQKGQALVREKQGAPPPNRVSRLLIVPAGCGERHDRTCETVLFHHAERVLGLKLDAPYDRFAQSFLKDALVKVLLVTGREAVSDVLLAL